MSHRRWRVLAILALTFAAVSPISTDLSTPAHANCESKTYKLIYPNECLLEYPDQSMSIGSGADVIKIIDTIESCDDMYYGIKTSTGYDYISYIRVMGLGASGELKLGQTYTLNIRFNQDCRRWSKAYLLSGEIQFSSGGSLPLLISETSYERDERYSAPLDSYCFSRSCGTSTFTARFTMPNSGLSGSAKLLINAQYDVTSAAIELPTISKSWSYSGSLFVGNQVSNPTPSPTPTTAPAPMPTTAPAPAPTSSPYQQALEIPVTTTEFLETENAGLLCYAPDFTPEAKSQYSIIGTKWRVSVNDGSGSRILDEYIWDLGAQSNGDPIREYTENGGKISIYTNNGSTLIYGYSVRNQRKGSMYECSVAVRTTQGIGRYNSKILTATFDTSNFSPLNAKSPASKPVTPRKVTKTITCQKGKDSLKISGRNPICPKGYKKK